MTSSINDATRAQIDAARPDASTWLSANAGSGKTRVLTDRVARLLLNEVQPQHILCLTYTKAAASEMQNRLFKRLGAWAMLKDAALCGSLTDLGVTGEFTPERLQKARTLFARAIETPGGLKIQTIHSFCASLLRRFPLEAGVSPQFTEIEDRAADLLRADIVDGMADGSDAALVADLARHYTGEDFSNLARSIAGRREAFERPRTWPDVLALFGQPQDLSEERIERAVFLGRERALLDTLIPLLLEKGGNDGKAGARLSSIGVLDISALPILEDVFLTGAGAKEPFAAKLNSTSGFPTKPTRDRLGSLVPQLEELMRRVEQARESRVSLNASRKTYALHQFAQRFLTIYDAEKQKRGWLDFDDLILKTRALLSNSTVAAWVLYRIDGGIDHILVDEAQDTSPRQWDVVEKLADEFYSGSGARETGGRTLFVVGDKKQSIYSFQGADPREFDHKQTIFEQKITGAGESFQRRSLEYSFRSSIAILRLVDTAFGPELQSEFPKDSQHRAFKSDMPGRVDLWPVVEKTNDEDDRVWSDPVDRRSPRHHTVILAEQIARRIKTLVNGTHYIPDESETPGQMGRRRIRAGDFLILVQRRSALFSEIIRACKAASLPIAGADRLKVGAELAVKDLAALLSFLATPEDSLSLATVLKSPLFGWTEQKVFDLAHRRSEVHLWQALRIREDHAETISVLQDLRGQVDFLRPYDLIERILTRHRGRARLLSRLGPEAEDGINALLSQALAYERTAVPSLTGFLVWMQTDDLEIKRQIDSASNQIRVMTVHGAKGLEAPIVILPDTGKRNNTFNDEIIPVDGVPVWKTAAGDMPIAMRTAIDAKKDEQAEERLRLLYVAITRAEKWLIIAAEGDLPRNGKTWYQIISGAMGHINATPCGDDGMMRFEEGGWDDLPLIESDPVSDEYLKLEKVFEVKSTKPVAMLETLSPSDLGGAKALPGETGLPEQDAKSYGSLVHRLLEIFPGQTVDAQDQMAKMIGQDFAAETLLSAVQEARAVLKNPDNAPIFSPDALLEVPISATIGARRLHGNIDRLVIGETEVLAVDYKTNRVIPETPEACPEGLLRQMGAYALALKQVFPDHLVKTAILWTSSGKVMDLPHDLVTKSLKSLPDLDAPDRRS